MSNNNTNNEKSSATIWVAIIGALAVVLAAYIGKSFDKKEPAPATISPITISNSQNNNNAPSSNSVESKDLPSIDVKADNQSKVYINNKGEQTIYEGK